MRVSRVRTPNGTHKELVLAEGEPFISNQSNFAFLALCVQNQVTLGKGSLVRVDLSKADVRKLAATFGVRHK